MVKNAVRGGGARPDPLRNIDLCRQDARNPGARNDLYGDGLSAGAKIADIAEQQKSGEARIGIIGVGLLDIVAHPAEFGLAEPRAVDEHLDRLELDQADDPARDAQDPAAIDDRLVDAELHQLRPDGRGFDLLRRDIDAERAPAALAIRRARR